MSVDFLESPFSGSVNVMDTGKASSQDDQSARTSFEAESPLYKTDEFRMYCFKVLPCSKRYCHDWTTCPFAHPGEKAKRRDPRVYQYTGIACPEMKKNLACPRGETCPYAHNVFEYWLHPSRYRTQLCNDGVQCKRKVCFFAHTLEELRVPSCKPVLPDCTSDGSRPDADSSFPAQGYAGGNDGGFAGLPSGAASPASTLGSASDLWDVSRTSASNSAASWSPYNSSSHSLPYPDHMPACDASPAAGNPVGLEQLAQTLAAMNLANGANAGEQPLSDILNLLMNQQLAAQNDGGNTAPAPRQSHGLPPASAAAAAAAALMPQRHQGLRSSLYGRTPVSHRPAFNFPNPRNTPSPSSCILGNGKLQPAPVNYHQSSLYAPSVPTVAQLQQAAQQAQAAYAAELESMRRRSLDSATQELYNRTLAAQQAEAVQQAQRRSLDAYASSYSRGMQQRWPSDSENTVALAQQQLQAQYALQQQMHVQQQQHKQHEGPGASEEAEQLLRSAFTSASQELQEEEALSGSLSASMASNLDAAMSMSGQASDDMFRMLSDLQQQQQQYSH